MPAASAWDWSPGKRVIWDATQCSQEYEWLEELYAGPDGEKAAAVVNLGEEFGFCVNGELQGYGYEKIWYPRFLPDGRLVGLVQTDMEWTVAVDGETWGEGETFAFVWDLKWSEEGDVVAAAIQQDGEYGMIVNGTPWEQLYETANEFALSRKGNATAAVVQIKSMAQADIVTFKEGIYALAVDGNVVSDPFMNIWTPVFDDEGNRHAAQLRLNLFEYSILVDGKPWDKTFQTVWDPCFNPATGDVAAPVRMKGKWGMALNGELIWDPKFVNAWHQQFTSDGKKLYAIVAPRFGRWTVAVDGKPWTQSVGEMVTDLAVSPDGKHAAAVAKDNGKYTVLADDMLWTGWYAMVWKPIFSPNSQHVAAKIKRDNGKYTVMVNNHVYHHEFDQLWDPVFSPEGTKVLLRAVEDGKFVRIVLPVNEI